VILRIEEDGGILTLSDSGFENGSGRINCEEINFDRVMRNEDTRVSFEIDRTLFGPIGSNSIALKDDGEIECKSIVVTPGKTTTDGCLITDNNTLQLGNSSSTNVGKCVSMLFVADAAIGSGRAVRIVESGGEARVAVVIADPLDDSAAVIGITMSATTGAGQTISVCVGGQVRACVASGASISIGDTIEVTDIVGQNGKFWAGSGQGVVGVALTGGTGNAGGTVFVRGIFVKNEVF
jgi:hypothetical protein